MSLATILTDEAPSSVSNKLTKQAVSEQRTRDQGWTRQKQRKDSSPETRDKPCSGCWYLFDHRLGDVGPEEHEVRVVAVRLRRDTVSSEVQRPSERSSHLLHPRRFTPLPRTLYDFSAISNTVSRAPRAPRGVSLRVVQLAL